MTTVYQTAHRLRASITLTVPSPAKPGPVRVSEADRPAVPLKRLPLEAAIGAEVVFCDNQQLPFRDGSVQTLRCFAAFEYVMDDQRLMHEAARILAAGARIEITVPNAGGLGRLDWLNALRYLRDTSGRGGPMPKLAETGWRRHYAPAELTAMMIQAGFLDIRIQTVGLGLRELGMFRDGMIGHLAGSRSRYGKSGPGDATGHHAFGGFFIPANLGARIVATATRSP